MIKYINYIRIHMELSKEIIDKLYIEYGIYYCFPLNSWTREKRQKFNITVYNENKFVNVEVGEDMRKLNKYELGFMTKIITGDNILQKGTTYIKEEENPIRCEDYQACICGCEKCHNLYRMYHKKTNIAFLVGSSCIERAGHPDFVKDIKKKNGRCINCNLILKIKGINKNYNKIYNGFCKNCYDNKNVKIILDINFKVKDYYKEFNIKWDSIDKTWYWVGPQNELPLVLKEKMKIVTKLITKPKIEHHYSEDEFRSDSDDEETTAGSKRF
jgi:Zn finger protein HypA/HybF involved in hydrogenase expression